jgi:Na+-driven multidrug efflux pump
MLGHVAPAALATVVVIAFEHAESFRPTFYVQPRRRLRLARTTGLCASVAIGDDEWKRNDIIVRRVRRLHGSRSRQSPSSGALAIDNAFDGTVEPESNGIKADTLSERSSKKGLPSNLVESRKLPSLQVGEGKGSSDGTPSPLDRVSIPTYRQLLVFLSTTVLIWLSEPLLSLVDTTVVGFTSKNSVVQLAALGPATTLYDSVMYTAYFLAIATTNKLAPAYAMKNYRKLQETTSHLLGVATLMGMVTMTVCYGAGGFVLRRMVTSGATAGELVHYATRYVWIRASVAVASVLGMVMQSFCLATLDTATPAKAVAVAFTVNVAGDILLRKRGIQGAAAATAISSLLATSILFRAVRRRIQEWRRLEVEESNRAHESMQKSIQHLFTSIANETDASVTNVMTVRFDSLDGLEQEKVTNDTHNVKPWTTPISVPFVSFPDKTSLIDLVKVAGPIFFVILAKSACYGAMTVRCADFGVLALATHCILMRVFFFYVTFGDAVSQAAQSFLPATLYPKIRIESFRSILQRLLIIGSLLSFFNSNAAVLILKKFGRFLSGDGSIIRLMSEQSNFLAMAVFLHPFITLFEGTVVASRDFRTLVTTYAVTLGLHFSILKFACGSFPAIWRTFFLFQSIRLVNFAFQVWRKQSRTRRSNTETPASVS